MAEDVDPMTSILGVDPGAEHVGVSMWEDGACYYANEMTPLSFAEWVHATNSLAEFDEVWAENYVPQGGFGNASTGMDTLRLLGLLEWRLRLGYGRELNYVTRLDRAASLKRMQGAHYPFVGAGVSDHARDAEAVVVAGKKWRIAELKAARPW